MADCAMNQALGMQELQLRILNMIGSYVELSRSGFVCKAWRVSSRALLGARWRVGAADVSAGSHAAVLRRMLVVANGAAAAAAGVGGPAPTAPRIELCAAVYALSGDAEAVADVEARFAREEPRAPDEDAEADEEELFAQRSAWERWRREINAWVPPWRKGKGGLLLTAPGLRLCGAEPGVVLRYDGSRSHSNVIEVRGSDIAVENVRVELDEGEGNTLCVTSGRGCEVRGCTLLGGQLYVEDAASLKVSDSVLGGSNDHGVSVLGDVEMVRCTVERLANDDTTRDGYPVCVWEGATCALEECTLRVTAPSSDLTNGAVWSEGATTIQTSVLVLSETGRRYGYPERALRLPPAFFRAVGRGNIVCSWSEQRD